MDLLNLNNDEMRRAIRTNQVSFPRGCAGVSETDAGGHRVAAGVAVFRAVLVAQRHRAEVSVIAGTHGQIVKVWRTLAVQSGYIQEIPDDPFVRASGD